MASGRDPELVRIAFERLGDGNVFERFAQQFLAAVNGADFVPVGGLHDRGIDGLQHIFTERAEPNRMIYQTSIQQDSRQKIRDTIKALQANGVNFRGLIYVTSRVVSNIDTLTDDMLREFDVPIWIRDCRWFEVNLNRDARTVGVFDTFVANTFHEYERPGTSFEITDLAGDPRLYVFLRQMFDERPRDVPLQTVLVDSLILFALEGTDPLTATFFTRDEIMRRIRELVNFDLAAVERLIDQRLDALSTKPRQIHYHRKENAYVLPFPTRAAIRNRNLRDAGMLERYREETAIKLERYGVPPERVAYAHSLLEKALHKLFRQQGLEFANFVMYNQGDAVVDKHLEDIIAQLFEELMVPLPEQPPLRAALVLTIREAVYYGSDAEIDLLSYLARTYSMLFLLQIDPQLYIYFAELASKLVVFVDTSIILPAMSEYFLLDKNQRYASLLVRSKQAGVRLFIEENTLDELVSHFVSLSTKYDALYKDTEAIYDTDEAILYVDEIMLRAYFYARSRKQVARFSEYLDTFLSPGLLGTPQGKDELRDWLREQYGIESRTVELLGAQLDRHELRTLSDSILGSRTGPGREFRARNDARMILAILDLRRRNNEATDAGAFGYKTWWLSMDTTTGRAAEEVLGRRYQNCYIRPDFLNDFVAFAPQQHAIDKTFDHMFPSMTGVSLSFHVPYDIGKETRDFVHEFGNKNPARVKATVRHLADQLKTSGDRMGAAELRTYLDDERARLDASLPRSFGG